MNAHCAEEFRPSGFYVRYGKRMFDVTLGVSLGLMLLPITVVIAAIVWLFSGRPLFFLQRRVGLRGLAFTIIKFRSMRVRLVNDTSVTIADDARLTAIGKCLRRYKLDELPQLWNVVRGDMSFVGPRPEVPEYAARLTELESEIFDVRPGITGPATLAYRNEEAILAGQSDPETFNRSVIYPHKIELNRAYVRSIRFASDVVCIAKTVLSCICARGLT
jgi:lipopolysaccharide/colanic/teichoic acid biosynthesis glycosyltransferase